ncbi:MAG TPA: c-type cytochrome [Methylomirabilota bacterium]|nr:c-type cytochrome [Methylomirabilota bacterium]
MPAPRGKLLQAALVLLVAFLLFRFAVQPPMPFSLLSLYMAIVLMAVLVYVSSDSDSWRAFVAPIWATLVEPHRRPLRWGLGILLPALVGYYAYSQAAARIEAPVELRAVHPAPPPSVAFRGKTIDLQATDTPVRRDIAANPDHRIKHLAAGSAIYIRNCVYCHGDNLDGQGQYAHGFNPAPANFTDSGTIAQLSEGYLFWRIAKGGPGLPKESSPWNSAMPAWEDRLTEEQIWQVIYYLYETTGYPPRRMDHAAAPRPATPVGPRVAALVGPRAALAQSGPDLGRTSYDKHCALCHGTEGKGDGPAADLLIPRPRDFTAGKYKIRSTPSGQLPTDEDLLRVITEGMPGTSMPPWRVLGEPERKALVAHVKTFAAGFKDAKLELAKVPPEVKPDELSIARGKEMFEAIECHKCHGQAGRGDPAPGSDLKDDWGHPIRPANLTKAWTFRGGPERKDVAMRLSTGLMGSPMPTFIDSVEKPEDIWHLANYVRSLGPDRPGWASLLPIRAAAGEVPTDPNAPFWKDVPGAGFPLVGQVIIDPRAFNPTVDMVVVRAVHTPQEIVFHLTWDDSTPSDPGQGAPKPDRIALQLPAGPGTGDRPYFLMGDGGHPVYLLTWTAGAGVGEAMATGATQLTPQAGEALQARGEAVYDAGQYRVVIRRPRQTTDTADFAFPDAQFFPVALWAWDGSEGEEGPRAAVSTWYYARLEAPSSRRQLVIPPIAVLATVAVQLGVLRWAQRRGVRPA